MVNVLFTLLLLITRPHPVISFLFYFIVSFAVSLFLSVTLSVSSSVSSSQLPSPFRSMSSRPSSTSSSSSDVAVRRRSSIVRLSCRPRPVRRATTTRQTPSTSTTMTKHRAASQGTNPRDPALCWETTM